jgi:hypothetical protein
MPKITLFIFFVGHFCLTNPVHAQSVCASEHLYADTAVRHFVWKHRRLTNQQYARQSVQARNNAVYEVKVVVHVLYANLTENLPDSLIEGQIAYLTRDFRAANPDSYKVRPIFANRIGDAGIEFKLETIIRKPLDKKPVQGAFNLPLYDALKVDSLGGSSAWDTNKYLNIWIFNIPPTNVLGGLGDVYGYATLPDSPQHYPSYLSSFLTLQKTYIPGVVIDVRTVSNGTPRFDADADRFFTGRILTHEVGHFLGLLHTFDSVLDIFAGNSCASADGLSDTPPQGNQSGQCIVANSCSTDVPDEPDMLENHMDYSDDACRVAFTQQQIAVMRRVLEGERSGLMTNVSSTGNAQKNIPQIEVIPNPAMDILIVQANVEWNTAELYNASGQLVKTFNQNDVLVVSNLPSGWYILCIKGQKNEVLDRKRIAKL